MVTIALVPHDPSWGEQFSAIGAELRKELGSRAVRIDHIGSTSVPGLAGKPIIDVQVSVGSFEPFQPVHEALERVGYVWYPHNDDRRKRYFKRTAPMVVNVHVRINGEFSQQAALLFRDYLRASPEARAAYERVKTELASREWPDVDAYADAKGDCVWRLIREADRWSWGGWSLPASDA